MKGVNYREPRGMPYVRREYISGKPQIKIARFSSGQARNDYDYKVQMLVTEKMQIRHNSLESARLAARVQPGQVIFEAHVSAANLNLAKDGFKVASSKLGCPTTVRIIPLREQITQKD